MKRTNPEDNLVRKPTLDKLIKLGWSRSSIICPSPDSQDSEWQVPKTPSEATKREAGRKFNGYPVDLVIFDSDEHAGEWDHVLGIFEFKAPNIDDGISQLITYLSHEPLARYGYWTNGKDSVAVYRLADGNYDMVKHAELPKPTDNLYRRGKSPLTFRSLNVPTEESLHKIFNKLLGVIVAEDPIATRPEQRLNELANLLIVKLESDKLGSSVPDAELLFQLGETPQHTASEINSFFVDTKKTRRELFSENDKDVISLSPQSIHKAVLELQDVNLKNVSHSALSVAFQVFREANLKLGDGQYFTPHRVIEAGVKMLDLATSDKVIDPTCGTGGFLYEVYATISNKCGDRADARTWAHDKLYGVDKDAINVKLARALMVGMGDGSTHIFVGDSIRTHLWNTDFQYLKLEAMQEDSYTVVVTNPPFGQDLRISSKDAQSSKYGVCKHTSGGKPSKNYHSTELGIAYVEQAYRLLKKGGRLGIVLPETYFFSNSYSWFRDWVNDHFILRGVLNIPMEAFQGFCRAKTNFYVLQKKGAASRTTHVPGWFKDGEVWVSNASTIGINKDGVELYKVDSNGKRLEEIDDKAILDVEALIEDRKTPTSSYASDASEFVGVPKYSDRSQVENFRRQVENKDGFSLLTVSEMVKAGLLKVTTGHGSPSSDLRIGDIPYIKVSDLRAGLVNVNSSNLVPRAIAERFWKGRTSGLHAYSVITPSRACKNIGEPAVLLPGQEDIVLTKEVLIFEPGETACFDCFYLAWALDLPEVKAQWDRIIFMQTNREDVGKRYNEIELPVPDSEGIAKSVSAHYRLYYTSQNQIRSDFQKSKLISVF